MASGLGKALAEGLAANDIAHEEREAAREKARQDERDAQVAMQRLYEAEQGVRRDVEKDERRLRELVVKHVDGYCKAARADVLADLKRDPRMPMAINYLERYNALLGMDDRREVLRLIEATIGAAEKAVQACPTVDVPAAIGGAAADFAKRIGALEKAVVGEPAAPDVRLGDVGADADDPYGAGLSGDGGNQSAGSPSAADAAEQAFRAAMGEPSNLEAEILRVKEESAARAQALSAKIAEAADIAKIAAARARHERAMHIAGRTFNLGRIPEFTGSVGAKLRHDPAKVAELAGLVRASFKTFSEVVCDNGLFAAFCQEGSYGACSGYSYWWDDLYDEGYYSGEVPGERKYADIPTDVREGEGGDFLERVCERMRTFNKQCYWGMLDDDFSQHVSAFWYGFKKLMEAANSLFDVDSRAFTVYCDALTDQAKSAVDALASQMDYAQASAFCKGIEQRGIDERTAGHFE